MKEQKQSRAKKRRIRAFNKAIEGFIEANEKEKQELLKSVVRLMQKGGTKDNPEEAAALWDRAQEVFPGFGRTTAAITFTEEETKDFTDPFKTVFDACDRVARCCVTEKYGGGRTYEIGYRRFGYNVKATGNTVREAKEKFIDVARRADE